MPIENVKIIIVEDDPAIAEVIRDIFETFVNRKVLTFGTADDAWEHIKSNQVHLIISDIDMPGKMDGLGLLEKAKKEFPEIIFIIMTGNIMPAREKQAEALGANVFLKKPFGIQDFITIVKKFITEEI